MYTYCANSPQSGSKNYKYLLLFEDDALIYNNFLQVLTMYMNELLDYLEPTMPNVKNYFDLLQLLPHYWCQFRKHYTQTKLRTPSKRLYYYSEPDYFAIATAHVLSPFAIKTILSNMPFDRNYDRFVGSLLEQSNTYRPIVAYGICPSIVGVIGDNSTLLATKLDNFKLPGFQRPHSKRGRFPLNKPAETFPD